MKLKQYDWVLFDADKTLFHFDAYAGLQRMFDQFKIDFTLEDYAAYQLVNMALWKQYGEGVITSDELRHQRFLSWSEKVNQSTETLNRNFLSAMADICSPLNGAVELLDSLRGQVKLGIITNGFAELQMTRLERHDLHEHFDILVSSDAAGVAKPHPDIFHYASNLMQTPMSERVLMVGDTLETDIQGGHNAGVHTCWLNAENTPPHTSIVPHYEVSSLFDLKKLLIR